MTGEEGTASDASAGDDRLRRLLSVPVGSSTGAAVGRRRTRRPRLVAAVLVGLWCTGIVLAAVGVRIVSESTNGRLVTRADDPSEPGYEALVDATPTMALLTVADDRLVGIAVLTLPEPDRGGGGVLVVPPRTVHDLAVLGRNPLEASFDFGDDGTLVTAVGELLGAGIAERVVVDDARWAGLVAPIGAVTLDNPNAVSVDGGAAFDVGPVALGPDDVGPYLRAVAPGETDLERMYRHELFFSAWLSAVAAHGGVDAVPGEIDTGVGRFVRALAGGASTVVGLPVVEEGSGDFGPDAAFELDPIPATDLLDGLIPFPTSPGPGVRARVRVLDGIGPGNRAADVARLLPPTGVEVVSIGNAGSFDADETTVRYGDPAVADAARAVAVVVGGEVIRDDRASDSFDITVTLGPDAPRSA